MTKHARAIARILLAILVSPLLASGAAAIETDTAVVTGTERNPATDRPGTRFGSASPAAPSGEVAPRDASAGTETTRPPAAVPAPGRDRSHRRVQNPNWGWILLGILAIGVAAAAASGD